MKSYLAGPLGFDEPGRRYLDCIIKYLNSNIPGLEIINPWTLTSESEIKSKGLKVMASVIYGNDLKGVIDADFIIAVLNGVQVDDGTAFELGYFKGYFNALEMVYGKPLDKKIVAYRDDFRRACCEGDGVDFNLMIDQSIIKPVAHNLDELISVIKSNFSV